MYKCICGKEFEKIGKLNMHKNLCKDVYIEKYGNLDKWNERQDKCIQTLRNGYKIYADQLKAKNKIKRENEITNWINEKHLCETCGRLMTTKYGCGRFCCRACANTRKHSNNTKQKISKSVSKSNTLRYFNIKSNKELEYEKNPNKCVICGKDLDYKIRGRKCCSQECLDIRYRNIGIEVAKKQQRRSKNEIAFCNKCEEYFGKENVLHNEPIFNGWDADIILPQYKLAILWNGPWHYKQVTKSHHLNMVKNRDKIKIKEIKQFNYIPYIIKDTGKYNYNKVDKEFTKLLKYLNVS